MRKLATALTLALVLPACGGNDDGVTPTTPSGPGQATIVVAQTGTAQVGLSPTAAFNFRVKVPFRVTESAGLGASFNFIRLSLLLNGAEVERTELGASAIAAGLGSNRIAASSTQTFNVGMDFNTSNFNSIRMDFNFTDDRGNNLTATLNSLDVQVVNGIVTSLPRK